jgi:hypothetical protein
METTKILIRNKSNAIKEIVSNFWMNYERDFESPEEFFLHYDFIKIMKELFGEEVNSYNLKDTKLYSKYIEALNTGVDNDDFKYAYLVKNDLAAYISGHLYLTNVSNLLNINEIPLFPWYYSGKDWYVCDTWGETDDEILTNLKSLPYVDFLKKYRIY